MTHEILYEQPVNELIRICLRLEQLFQQALHGVHGSSLWDTRLSLNAIVDMLNILDRPDLKAKLSKELHRHLISLSKLEQTPDVDTEKLSTFLKKLEGLVDILYATNGKIAQELRDNEFLGNIRNQFSTPGGAWSFDCPAFYLWLQRPAAERNANISHWLKTLEPTMSAVQLLLGLTRDSCTPQEKVAINGFFLTSLSQQIPCQLIRVSVSSEFYPEISVGRHGIAVRFYTLSLSGRPAQSPHEIIFKLTTCII